MSKVKPTASKSASNGKPKTACLIALQANALKIQAVAFTFQTLTAWSAFRLRQHSGRVICRRWQLMENTPPQDGGDFGTVI
jgi:hypothetical protein